MRLHDWSSCARREQPRPADRFAWSLSDQEWESVRELVEHRSPTGRPRTVDLRSVLDAILYVLDREKKWDNILLQYPSRTTVHFYFQAWRELGVMEKIYVQLFEVRLRPVPLICEPRQGAPGDGGTRIQINQSKRA